MTEWRHDNCLFYAARKAINNGSYVAIRMSFRIHKWPFFHCHFLVVPKKIIDDYAESFVPDAKTLGNYPCPFFKGHIKKGDV